MGASRSEVSLRFYAELNEHLPPAQRRISIAFAHRPGLTVGTVLEQMRVPVRDLELVLVNGESADLSRELRAGDRVSFYPVFETLDVNELLRLRRQPLRQLRFLITPELESLGKRLRARGLPVSACATLNDAEVSAATREGWVLLARDSDLLQRLSPERAYLVRTAEPERQLREVIARFFLEPVAADRPDD